MESAAHASRQMTLPCSTALTHEVADAVLQLFNEHWQGMPVTNLYVSLNQLSRDNVQQLGASLFRRSRISI